MGRRSQLRSQRNNTKSWMLFRCVPKWWGGQDEYFYIIDKLNNKNLTNSIFAQNCKPIGLTGYSVLNHFSRTIWAKSKFG